MSVGYARRDVRGMRAPGCPWDVRGVRAPGCLWGTRAGMYVGCARRGLVASAPAPTGYLFRRPCRGFGMRALGRRGRAGRQRRSADVLGRARYDPQSGAPTPAGNKVDQAPTGAHRSVAGERCRGRGKLPARASHVPPAPGARIPRPAPGARPTYLPLPARASHVPPAPGARIPRTSRSRRAHPTYLPLPARASHVPPAPGARSPAHVPPLPVGRARASPTRTRSAPPPRSAGNGGRGPQPAKRLRQRRCDGRRRNPTRLFFGGS